MRVETEKGFCYNCRNSAGIGFSVMRVSSGDLLDLNTESSNHIIFLISGEVRIEFNEFDEIFGSREMVTIPRMSKYRGRALADTYAVVLRYDHAINVCDSKTLQRNFLPCLVDREYKFHSLRICDSMQQYLELLVVYIDAGMTCGYLHDIKQKELFLIFKTFYDPYDIIYFFYYQLGSSYEFRSRVNENYMKAKTVEELAGICGYELMTFQRLFKKNFNETPYQWMLKQSARHIRERLADRSVPIKAIASEFGFSSQSHFNTYCKKYLGSTPLKIRNLTSLMDMS